MVYIACYISTWKWVWRLLCRIAVAWRKPALSLCPANLNYFLESQKPSVLLPLHSLFPSSLSFSFDLFHSSRVLNSVFSVSSSWSYLHLSSKPYSRFCLFFLNHIACPSSDNSIGIMFFPQLLISDSCEEKGRKEDSRAEIMNIYKHVYICL